MTLDDIQEEQPIQICGDPRLGRTVLLIEQSEREKREVKGMLAKIERFKNGDEFWSVRVNDLIVAAIPSFFRPIESDDNEQRQQMQQRYNFLSALLPPKGRAKTPQENTEQAYLYYVLYPERIPSILGTMPPEEICEIAWCAQCQMAHPSGNHKKES